MTKQAFILEEYSSKHEQDQDERVSVSDGDSGAELNEHSDLESASNKFTGDRAERIEKLLEKIENAQIDLTSDYYRWVNIGFALTDGFGAAGGEYFHRFSKFYPGYEASECDAQYDKCLSSQGKGITLATLFHYAKEAGVHLNEDSPSTEEKNGEKVRSLPDWIFERLPSFLKQVVQHAPSSEQRDILLLGSVVSLGACLDKFYGFYGARKVHPNLFLFISAQASAGKGILTHCKQLVEPIHRSLRTLAKESKKQYEIELGQYNSSKGKSSAPQKPEKPAESMLIVPANSSASGFLQLLSENNGRCLLFETEGDTLTQSFKSDYGNYSDSFRKAFHHESISYYRKTDREYVDIEFPCVSALLSGTPKQVQSLIPSAENGLFSRFMFYLMNVDRSWQDVFVNPVENGLDHYFNVLAEDFFSFYSALSSGKEIQFRLTPDQQERFNQTLAGVQERYLSIKSIEYVATVRRLGLIGFRIAMVLSAIRLLETGEIPEMLECNNDDFQISLGIISMLVKHSAQVFSLLPEDQKPKERKSLKEGFLDALPEKFDRKKYVETANKLSIPDKTAQRYIGTFCKSGLLLRHKHNLYLKNDH